MKKIFSILALLGVFFASCTQDLSEFDKGADKTSKGLDIRLADFMVGGNISSVPEEGRIEDLAAYVFVDGMLAKTYKDLPVSGNLNLKVEEKEGMLYVVANGQKHSLNGTVGSTLEADWVKQLTAAREDRSGSMFFVGVENLKELWEEGASSITLQRGMARLDVIGLSDRIKLKEMGISQVADQGYFFPQSKVQTPEGVEMRTVNNAPETPLSADWKGALYLYEQTTAGMKVQLTLEMDGVEKVVQASLEAISAIKRNAVYTLKLDEASGVLTLNVLVDEWEDGGNTILPPDFGSDITVDPQASILPGAEVVDQNHGVRFVYTASEGVLSLSCGNELELVPLENQLVKVTPFQNEEGQVEVNKFKITKNLLPPGTDTSSVVLQFKRKGLTEVYEEDKIILSFEENPTKLTGDLHFDIETATCDFETYVENELGVFEVEEGKKVEAVFEGGEDPWLLVKPVPEAPRTFRVLAGWKPNDPKADGRVQEAKIRIVNEEATSTEKQLGVETYTVRRRTKKADLPVVNINGTWWCKYNLRGDATNIYDQILTTNDPANGQDLVSYIQGLQDDDFLAILGGQYQGGHTEELPLKYDTEANSFYYEGFSNSAQDFSTLPDTAMVPSGYRLPHKEDYIFFTSKTSQEDFNLGGSGKSQNYVNKFDKNVSVHIYAKENVNFCGGTYGTVNYFEFTYEGQKLVLCGLGHQWEQDKREVALLNIIFATHGVKNHSWNIEGYTWEQKPRGENWLKFPEHNAKKTRTIRCIKKEVPEYIY